MTLRPSVSLAVCLVLVGIACTGCGKRRKTIRQAKVNIPAVTESVFAEYDKNGDQALSADELKQLPAVKSALKFYDKNSDGKVSKEEFQKHLETVFDARFALTPAMCEVKRNGKPFEGAKVRFIPIDALADAIPVASGVVADDGSVILGLAPDDMPAGAPPVSSLIRQGLYRVEITHPSVDVPAKYNTKTILGREVSGDTTREGAFKFSL